MILKCYFLQLRQAEFTNGWGTSRVILCWYSPVKYKNHQHSHQQQQHHYHFQALSRISNVEFRVSSGGSVALCSLAFDTNLRKIDFAGVTKILVLTLVLQFLQVSCQYFFVFYLVFLWDNMDCNCFAGFLPTAPIFQRRLLLFRTHWAFLDILHQFRLELIMTMVLVVMSKKKHHNPENTTFKNKQLLYQIPDEEVYNIYAEISFNPKTNMLFDLRWEPSLQSSQSSSVRPKSS